MEIAREDPADIPQPSIERAESTARGRSQTSHELEPTVYGGVSAYRSDSSEDIVIINDSAALPSGPVTTLALRSANPPPRSPTKKPRNPHTRLDGLTDVCGVYSPATNLQPVTTISSKPDAKHTCPRCLSTMTRARTVKDHFPGCIAKHGNPQSLKYTDHPSMQTTEKRRLHDRSITNGGDSNDDGDTEMSDADGVPVTEGWVQGQ